MRYRARHSITCQIAVLEILYGGLDASESLRFLPPLQALAWSVFMHALQLRSAMDC
jgi:hypothetical protein